MQLLRRLFTCLLLSGFLLQAAEVACGHGFELTLENNRIVADHNSFKDAFTDVGDRFFAEDGGIEAGTGFTIPGDTFRFDVVTRLWFSDGTAAVPAAPGVMLEISDATATNVENLTGNTVGRPGFRLSGTASDGEINWTLKGANIPDGVYGLAYVASGENQTGEPFLPSDRLVLALRTPDFAGNGPAAENAVFAAAIPEPSSLSLASLALLVGLCLRVRMGG